MRFVRSLALLFAALFACAAVALAAPDVKLTLTQALIVRHDGKTVETSVPSTGAKYGSVLRYTIVATNAGDEPALQLAPVGHVPKSTTYVAGSGLPASGLRYTLDGKTWSARPMLRVRQPDGKIVEKAADPSTYVSLRWSVPKLLPKRSMTFTYEVIVR